MPRGDVKAEAEKGKAFSTDRIPAVARLLLAIVVVQAVFWLLLNPILFGPGHGPHTSFELSNYEAAELATPDAAGLAGADFKPIEGPGWWDCCGPGYRGLRFQFTLPEVPEEGLGFLPQVSVDNFQVRINGSIVLQHGKITLPNNTYHGNERRIEFVPASAVRAGVNQVEYIMVRNAMPYFDLMKPVLGPRHEIETAYAWQAFLLGPFEMSCIVAGFVLAGFAFILFVQSEAKGFAFALFLLILAWTLKAHHYSWSDPPMGGELRLFYYFMVTAMVPLAWLNFANCWTGRPIRWVGAGCLATFGLVAVLTAYSLWGMPPGEGFDFISEVTNIVGTAFMALTLGILAWHMIRHGDDRHWEVAIFVLILLLAVLEFANEYLWQETTGYFTRTNPLLILSLAIAVFARSIRLFRSADQINQVLSQRLALREQELLNAHDRERELIKRQAHDDERQRILRDMHDGLGSQLMSMLLAARRGEARPERMAEGLQSVIDEMRLMIASMDSVGESLFAALSLFHDRVAPRIEGAGFRLDWSNSYGTEFPEYGPRPTLHVFRILQEAVTNALKHSGGKTIWIVIEPKPTEAERVRITVRDDGAISSGTAGDGAGTGRGVANMRTRATAIGAVLDMGRDDKGMYVMLDLPMPGHDTAAKGSWQSGDGKMVSPQ